MKIKRLILLTSLVVCTIFGKSVTAFEWDAFRVCADPNNMPLSNQNKEGYENRIAEIFATDLGVPLEFTWFPQRLGFIRNTLRAQDPARDGYKCDVVMGVPKGFELAITTKPYFRSTYALVFRKDQEGLESVNSTQDFLNLDENIKKHLRIGIFSQTAAATWLLRHGLMKQVVPFTAMSGDPAEYPGKIIERELIGGTIDVAILWGPIAGYFVNRSDKVELTMVPVFSEPDIKFDFAISMGVRFGDGERKRALEELIDRHAEEIEAVLKEYNVPLVAEDGALL